MGFRTSSDLVGEITPDERAEIDATKEEAAVESVAFNLAELRQARKMTKLELAHLIGRAQPVASHMEETDDHLLSTIQGVVESLGGRLELIAVFDDVRIPIDFSPPGTARLEDREHMTAAVDEGDERMSKPRDTYKYRFVGPDGRIKHSGITNDLKRRESELRRQYGPGDIRQEGRRTTREAARRWERGKPTAGRSGPWCLVYGFS